MSDDQTPEGNNTNIKGNLIGSAVDGSTVNAENIAGRDINIYGYTVEQVTTLITEIRHKEQPTVWDGRIPYLGLTSFRESDAQFFFGRENLVDDLLDRVQRSNFVVITGPSGSGKSSLARAGLFYALENNQIEKSKHWILATMQPENDPIEQLAMAMERATGSMKFGDGIRAKGLVDPKILQRQIELHLKDDPRQRCVLLVDQFEATFTQTKKEENRTAFINLLTATQIEGSRTIIVLALRSDFISAFASYKTLNDLLNQEFCQIGTMLPQGLAKAITLPALEVGAKIDPKLVTRIMTDMKGEPGALPLMSFALRDLFEAEKTVKGQSINLTLAKYVERGGIESALERHANKVFDNFTNEQKVLARNIFSKLIEVDQGRVDTRRTVTLQELIPTNTSSKSVMKVIGILSQKKARLITTDMGNIDGAIGTKETMQVTVTLAHEKLIDAWPWLRQLVNENRNMIILQNQISSDAQAWVEEKDVGFLYRGGRLIQVEEQLEASIPHMSKLSQQFIRASLAQRQMEIDEKENQRRRTIIGLSFFSIILLFAFAVAIFFFLRANSSAQIATTERAEAIQQGKISLGLFLASQAPRLAKNQIDQDDDLATLLTLEAQRLNSETGNKIDKVVDNTLRPLLTQNYYSNLLEGNRLAINSAAFSPNGKSIAFTNNNGSVWYWDISNPDNDPVALNGYTEGETTLIFSFDNNTLASGNKDGTVKLWNIKNLSNEPIILKGNTSAVTSITFDSNGNKLAIGTEDGQVLFWDVTNLPDSSDPLLFNEGHQRSVNVVAFTSDGQTLASGSMDGTVKLWQVANSNAVPTSLELPKGVWVWDVAFSPNEKMIAIATQDELGISPLERSNQPGTVWLFSNFDTNPVILEQNDWAVKSLGFSSDGETLALGSLDGTVRLLSLLNPTSEAVILEGHRGTVESVSFTPDKTKIFTSSADGTLRLWNLSTSNISQVILEDHLGVVFSVDFSPNGETLVTASSLFRRFSAVNSGNVRLWKVADPTAEPIIMENHQGPVFEAAYFPDGETLASTSMVDPIWLWQTTNTSAAPTTILGFSEEYWKLNSSIRLIALSPDGKLVASDSLDATILIWDVLNPDNDPTFLESQAGDVIPIMRLSGGICKRGAGLLNPCPSSQFFDTLRRSR